METNWENGIVVKYTECYCYTRHSLKDVWNKYDAEELEYIFFGLAN